MRSLTISSADTPIHFLPDSPTASTQLSSAHVLTPHTHAAAHCGTPIPHRNPPHPPLTCRLLYNVADSNALLSSQSKSHVAEAIQGSWATSTLKRYSGAVDQFIRFCDMEGIPDHLRFPADEFVLCAFAASSVRRHSVNTPRNRMAALKAWHAVHNLEWKGSARLRYVLNGVHNLAPDSSRHLPRPPVNAIMISQLVQRLDLNSPVDVAVAAGAATAFGVSVVLESYFHQIYPLHPLPSSLSVPVSKDLCATPTHAYSAYHGPKHIHMVKKWCSSNSMPRLTLSLYSNDIYESITFLAILIFSPSELMKASHPLQNPSSFDVATRFGNHSVTPRQLDTVSGSAEPRSS